MGVDVVWPADGVALAAATEPLVPLTSGSSWLLWRRAGVRGAGFPAQEVLELAMPGAARAADRLLSLEEGLDEPGDASADTTAARRDFETEFEAARRSLSDRVLEIASDGRFREAVLWQNRRAVETGIDRLLAMDPPEGQPNKRRRQREQLVAAYFHRYCAKNDTIGFFGPFSWGRIVPDLGEPVRVRPGADLVSHRHVFFEGWAIDAVADVISGDEAFRPWSCPRRWPFLRMEGLEVSTPTGERQTLTPQEAAVLVRCDGDTTARELAEALLRDPSLGFADEADVLAVLAGLAERGLCAWSLELPKSLEPERHLVERLSRVTDGPVRERLLAPVHELLSAREAVAAAAGDPAALDDALGGLATTFGEVTGRAATRAAGRTYAGRTLVFEDCRRDLEIAVGGELLSRLGPPLTLLLTAARWLAHELARSFRAAATDLHEQLRQTTGSETVELLAFWRRVTPLLLPDDRNPLRGPLLAGYRERWSRILRWRPGDRQVAFRVKALSPEVLEAFSAPDSGWDFARCHSPDLLIAAESLESLQRGDYELVLGELHAGINTLLQPLHFTGLFGEPADDLQDSTRVLPRAPVSLVLPKPWSGFDATRRLGVPLPATSSRLNPRLVPGPHFHLELGSDPSGAPADRRLPVGEMIVERTDRGLAVATRDGRHRFDVVEFFSYPLSAQLVAADLGVAPRAPHTPRIRFDRLIVGRETWRFPAGSLDWAAAGSGSDGFLEIRRWGREHHLPRFLFASVPLETKPLFVDLEAPLAAELFAKAVRRAAKESPGEAVVVSEMLPSPDQTWLPDAAGRRYTSELRLVAVDGEGWNPTEEDPP